MQQGLTMRGLGIYFVTRSSHMSSRFNHNDLVIVNEFIQKNHCWHYFGRVVVTERGMYVVILHAITSEKDLDPVLIDSFKAVTEVSATNKINLEPSSWSAVTSDTLYLLRQLMWYRSALYETKVKLAQTESLFTRICAATKDEPDIESEYENCDDCGAQVKAECICDVPDDAEPFIGT